MMMAFTPKDNVAEYIAQSLTKDKNNVFVVAPAFEQSGSGHGLKSYREPVTLEEVGLIDLN